VEDADLPTIARQAKSPAAEAAIKMNVYQADTTGETEVPQPEEVPEPTKVASTKPAAEDKNITDVVKKWSKK
jgi:hypothetical protein